MNKILNWLVRLFIVTLVIWWFIDTPEQKVVEQKDIDLSALNEVECIFYYEVREDSLVIITVEDYHLNELERMRYLRELEDGWDID